MSLSTNFFQPVIHRSSNISVSSFKNATKQLCWLPIRPWMSPTTRRTTQPLLCLLKHVLPLNTEANEPIRITVVWTEKKCNKANLRMHVKFSCVRKDKRWESAFKHTAFAFLTVLNTSSSSEHCKHVFHSTTVVPWELLVFSTSSFSQGEPDKSYSSALHKSPVVHYKAVLVKRLLICPAFTHIRHTASRGISVLLSVHSPRRDGEMTYKKGGNNFRKEKHTQHTTILEDLQLYNDLLEPNVLQ